MLSIDRDVRPLLEREAAQLSARHPEQSRTIDTLVQEFLARFREELHTFPELLDLCGRVQSMLEEHEIPDPLVHSIESSRRQLLIELIEKGMREQSLTGTLPLHFQEQFPTGRQQTPNGGRNGNRRETRQRSADDYEEIVRRQNFDLLRLAAGLGIDAAADVLCALGQVGDDERARVTSFLTAYLGVCARQTGVDIGTILCYPKAVLEVPAVRTVARKLLLQDVYTFLLEQGGDDPQTYRSVRRKVAGLALQRMRALAQQVGVNNPTIHASLFVELSEFFQRACNQKHPDALVPTLQEKGRECPFPSLRQLIAIQILRERRKLYVGFEPGLGKTPIPFYLLEQLREEARQENKREPRILYLGPLPVIQELPNRIRPGTAPQATRDCYYRNPEQEAPTVGIFASALKTPELVAVVQQNQATFAPYTMIHSERSVKRQSDGEDEAEEQATEEPANEADAQVVEQETIRMIDILCSQDWDILVLDEAQYIDGNKAWTRLVDRLIHGEDGRGTHLSRNGYIVALSGSPIMNTVADPVIIHDLLCSPQERRQRYGIDIRQTEDRDTGTERGLDPIRVRQALNETLLILDTPEDWIDHVRMLDYELTPEEMRFLNAICSNPTLHAREKIDACMRFILCPKLVSGDHRMPESLLEWVKMQLNLDLSEKNSILIAENMRAQGVLRPETGEEAPTPGEMDLHFFRQLQQYGNEWEREHDTPLHFHTVHGKTPATDRQTAYTNAAIAKAGGGTLKSLIFAMTQCLNVGIRLAVERMLSLEWPHNSPVIQQLLKRALREGDTDVYITACYARNTVQQGIYEQAMDKYRDALSCLYGAGVSDEILRAHISERDDNIQTPGSEADLLRIFQRSSPIERRYQVERWLQGRGLHGVRQFWERHRDLFTVLHEEADELGTGDMQRFVGALTTRLMDRLDKEMPTIFDINSGGLTLERELRRTGSANDALIMSLDPLTFMLERGRTALHRDQINQSIPACMEAQPAEVHRLIQSGQLTGAPFDIAILRNLEQCNHQQSDMVVHERARTLLSALQAIPVGGRIVLPLSRTACTEEEFSHFVTETLPKFGCLALDGWSGTIRSQDNETDQPFRGFCVVAEKVEDLTDSDLRSRLQARDLQLTHHANWMETAEGIRVMNALRRPRLPYPLRHRQFRFGNRDFEAADVRSDARQAQTEHLQTLEYAVGLIRRMAPNVRAWNALPANEKQALSDQGILHSAELSRTVRRPTFSLRQYPGHLFFPYDPQWS